MISWKKLKSKIPHKVEVARKVFYEILWVDSFVNERTMGETRFDLKQIVVKNNLSPKDTVHTYLHEYAHAASHEHGIELTENQVLAFEETLQFILKYDNIFKGSGKNERKRKASRRVQKTRRKTR